MFRLGAIVNVVDSRDCTFPKFLVAVSAMYADITDRLQRQIGMNDIQEALFDHSAQALLR